MSLVSPGKDSCRRAVARYAPRSFRVRGSVLWLGLCVLLCGLPAGAQSQQSPAAMKAEGPVPDAQGTGTPAQGVLPERQSPGTISGVIVVPTGAVLAGARVTLTREDQSPARETLSGEEGQFFFAGIAPGPFQLVIASEGFATQTIAGVLHPGEDCVIPQIMLALATAITQVRVELTQVEIAQVQLSEEEKQRVLGIIPNFYVSYIPDAAPLTAKQKFELALKNTIDPVSFGINGAVAGFEQAGNGFSEYGQGAKGYGKRYGAAFADSVTGGFFGDALFPSLFRQDPRYFYKGTGSKRSRILYALANAVICKSDKGRWQPNYSGILGSIVSGGISNAYYPPQARGAPLVFEGAAIGIGASAAANIFQEFVVRKLTPNLPHSAKP